MMPIKLDIDFFKSAEIPCATAADMKLTKLHVKNAHVQIEKCKNDARVVQTHVDLKNIKFAGLQSPTEVYPSDLSWRAWQNKRYNYITHYFLQTVNLNLLFFAY